MLEWTGDVKIQFCIYFEILQCKESAVCVILKQLSFKRLVFSNLTASQLPNYTNSLGMRHSFRFVLLFLEVYWSVGEGGNREGKKSAGRKDEKKEV